MNKISKFAVVASVLFYPQIANANLPNGKLNGISTMLIVNSSYSCNMEVNISNNNAVAYFSSSPLCDSTILGLGAATISGTTVSFNNATLITNLGYCSGSLQGSWDGTNLAIYGTLIGAMGICIIDGSAN